MATNVFEVWELQSLQTDTDTNINTQIYTFK